jgi:hypothetical protein
VISTDITRTTTDGTVDRGRALGTSGRAAVSTVDRTAMPTVQKTTVDHRITAELCASSFAEGRVWVRPAAIDVLVQTTPGHLAWSPPT